MKISEFFDDELQEHLTVMTQTQRQLRQPFAQLVTLAITVIHQGGKIMLFGNGGSAADAQHLATELTVRYGTDRKPIAAIALTTDSSTLTAIGNDFGFERLFARQIEALACPDDLALAITTSGRSPNIVEALKTAGSMGLHRAAFCGKGGGELQGLADPLLVVPSNSTARIQEMHIALGHMLCGALEQGLGYV